MPHEYQPRSLPIKAFAQAQDSLEVHWPLADMQRVHAESLEMPKEGLVVFSALGTMRPNAAGRDEPWLQLRGATTLRMTCQRCLGPVDVEVSFDRAFRFVATEALAAVEDDESEEDVLVLSSSFNLVELVEDELLMAMPVVPKHTSCPTVVQLAAADPDFSDGPSDKPHPFAVLQQLKK